MCNHALILNYRYTATTDINIAVLLLRVLSGLRAGRTVWAGCMRESTKILKAVRIYQGTIDMI